MPAIIPAADVLQEIMAADTKKPVPTEALAKYRAFQQRFPGSTKPEGEKLERDFGASLKAYEKAERERIRKEATEKTASARKKAVQQAGQVIVRGKLARNAVTAGKKMPPSKPAGGMTPAQKMTSELELEQARERAATKRKKK